MTKYLAVSFCLTQGRAHISANRCRGACANLAAYIKKKTRECVATSETNNPQHAAAHWRGLRAPRSRHAERVESSVLPRSVERASAGKASGRRFRFARTGRDHRHRASGHRRSTNASKTPPASGTAARTRYRAYTLRGNAPRMCVTVWPSATPCRITPNLVTYPSVLRDS